MHNYIGVDRADEEGAVWVVNDAGDKVLSRRVAHTVAARSEWARWLRERQAEGLELWAAIERPHGRIVDFVLDHGVIVYLINPRSLDRARDRFRVSGAKSDPFDAQVLALFLRSDHLQLRPLRPNSEAAQELEGLTRDYRRQVHLQTRLLNRLTAPVKEYYPRALELCADLTAGWTQAFLARYPTPAAAATLNSGELAPTLSGVAEYRQAIDGSLSTMPMAEIARSLPGGKSGTTVPAIWAEPGDNLDRWDSFRHVQSYAGSVPETERSGKHHLRSQPAPLSSARRLGRG